MKNMLLILLLIMPLSLIASERCFEVCKKEFVNTRIRMIKRDELGKIIDVEMDNCKDGYAKIIYEK